MTTSSSTPSVIGFFIPPSIPTNGLWSGALLGTCGESGVYAVQRDQHVGSNASSYPPTVSVSRYSLISNIKAYHFQHYTITGALGQAIYTTQTTSGTNTIRIEESCTLSGADQATCTATFSTSGHAHPKVTTSTAFFNDTAAFSSHVYVSSQ